jgi:hypothetical protein
VIRSPLPHTGYGFSICEKPRGRKNVKTSVFSIYGTAFCLALVLVTAFATGRIFEALRVLFGLGIILLLILA